MHMHWAVCSGIGPPSSNGHISCTCGPHTAAVSHVDDIPPVAGRLLYLFVTYMHATGRSVAHTIMQPADMCNDYAYVI